MDEQDEDALFDQLAKNLQAVRQDAELVRSRGFEGISAGVARAEAALETVTAENEALRQRLEQQQAVTERLEAAAVKSEADLERLRQTVNELSRRVRAQAELLGQSSGGGLRRGAWVGIGVIVVVAGCAAAWIALGPRSRHRRDGAPGCAAVFRTQRDASGGAEHARPGRAAGRAAGRADGGKRGAGAATTGRCDGCRLGSVGSGAVAGRRCPGWRRPGGRRPGWRVGPRIAFRWRAGDCRVAGGRRRARQGSGQHAQYTGLCTATRGWNVRRARVSGDRNAGHSPVRAGRRGRQRGAIIVGRNATSCRADCCNSARRATVQTDRDGRCRTITAGDGTSHVAAAIHRRAEANSAACVGCDVGCWRSVPAGSVRRRLAVPGRQAGRRSAFRTSRDGRRHIVAG